MAAWRDKGKSPGWPPKSISTHRFTGELGDGGSYLTMQLRTMPLATTSYGVETQGRSEHRSGHVRVLPRPSLVEAIRTGQSSLPL